MTVTKPPKGNPSAPSDDKTPLDRVFAEVFAAADAGEYDRVGDLLAEANKGRTAGLRNLVDLDQPGPDNPFLQMPVPLTPGAVVLKALPETGKNREDSRKPYKPLVGKHLPLITRGNPAEHHRALVAIGPHLEPVSETMIGDLANREVIRLRPTIIVGEPGSGKSWFARELASQLGMPSVVFPAGGVADGTFQGTAAHWSNSAPSVPMQIILQTMTANPLIIIDEIDKATQGSHNGSLHDALLAFIDRGNAATYRDASLETVVDLSHVNYVLTANDIDAVSAPLRDRCRIIRMPQPSWQHIGPLVRSILNDLADERDIDRRWLEDLDGDELQVLKRHWKQGSIRQLRRIVETMVDVRDAHLPRA